MKFIRGLTMDNKYIMIPLTNILKIIKDTNDFIRVVNAPGVYESIKIESIEIIEINNTNDFFEVV